MKILSIETSCDETAVSIVEAKGGLNSPSFIVLGNALFSQIATHKEYGGVYPMLAKRDHVKNLPPLLEKVLEEAGVFVRGKTDYTEILWKEIEEILSREEGLYMNFREKLENVLKPEIDFITVTSGPGLEPALWAGISFAVALSRLWDLPLVSTNHMEGHIASILLSNDNSIDFPALAVLISGGHTEIVNIDSWGKYKVIGETVDDAVGEAFDKVARLLGLPYPGGPEVSRLAEYARVNNIPHEAKLPRPMLHTDNLNFSFSGLKTAVLYYIRDHFHIDIKKDWKSPIESNLQETVIGIDQKADLAREFEDAVIEVLLQKTIRALNETRAKTLIVAGGVIANKKLRSVFLNLENDSNNLKVRIPENSLATDNSLMIAFAAYINILLYPELLSEKNKVLADGNLKLGKIKIALKN
jgi:N6-L-threonylcarbamoyladenine synthase